MILPSLVSATARSPEADDDAEPDEEAEADEEAGADGEDAELAAEDGADDAAGDPLVPDEEQPAARTTTSVAESAPSFLSCMEVSFDGVYLSRRSSAHLCSATMDLAARAPDGETGDMELLVARNPADSSLPYLMLVPLGSGLVFRTRGTWPQTSALYCHPVPLSEWPEQPDLVAQVPLTACTRRGAAIDLVADRAREQRSQ